MNRNSRRFLALFLAAAMSVTPASYVSAKDAAADTAAVPEEETGSVLSEEDAGTAAEETEGSNTVPEETEGSDTVTEEIPETGEDSEVRESEPETEDQQDQAEESDSAEIQIVESEAVSNGEDLTVSIATEMKTKPELTSDSEQTSGPEAEAIGDGEYQLAVDSSAAMFKVIKCVLTSKAGKLTAVITLSGTGYDKLYMGSAADAGKADDSEMILWQADADGKYTYTVPVESLDTPIAVAAHSIKNDQWYDRTLTFRSEGMTRIVPDGDYKVTVDSSASMFRVVDCILTSKGGKLSAVITLSGTGYDYLYMGTLAEAMLADPSSWIPFAENAEGKYTYAVPVEALDKPIAVAAHSIKNEKWYDRELTFRSEGMVKIENGEKPGESIPDESKPGDSTSGGNPSGGNPSGGNPSGGSPSGTAKPDSESKYESDLSGTTGRVDNTTALKDGVYTPDKFSWSGGTGRVSITCPKVTVTNGQAYATIVFGSDSYAYLKANGNKYYASHSGNTSVFVIPVVLNQNNQIVGMTTKMSAAHEITYQIFIYLAAAAKADGVSVSDISDNQKLDEKAPEIMGLTYESETALEYAEYFKIYHYDQGITLLEIDMTKDTVRDPKSAEAAEKKEEKKTEDLEDAAAKAELYQGNVVKYLIVPEDAEIPAGLDKELIVVRQPVDSVYTASNEALQILDELKQTEKIRAVGCKKEDCEIPGIREALEKGTAVEAGAFDRTEFKAIVKAKCNLAILPAEMLPNEKTGEKEESEEKLTTKEQTERLAELAEKYVLLGIPMIVDRSAEEKEELAQREWVKVYGVLLGCEEKAAELFDAAAAARN